MSKKREDLTGQLFTRWKVIDINWEKTKETGRTYWNVTCTNDGNKGCVSVNSLKSGKSKSCGCLRDEKASKRKGKNHPNWKEKVTIFCKQCGKEKEVISSKRKTQFCCRKCHNQWKSENFRGKNGSNWKNGITPLQNLIRTSKKHKKFVQKTLKKANYICQVSKEVGGDLNIHHIKGFAKILKENNITTREEALECKELWDEKNVVVLSEKWHSGIKTDNPNAFHRVYGTVNFTEEDFYEWFDEFKIDFK